MSRKARKTAYFRKIDIVLLGRLHKGVIFNNFIRLEQITLYVNDESNNLWYDVKFAACRLHSENAN